MKWLGLDWDEGPVRQTERLERYKEMAQQLIDEGKAYYCYCSREELDQMREAQRARGEKPRYDGRWRPENVKALGLCVPAGMKPVLRFRNPSKGEVTFQDLVKGSITVSNSELDDLVILRADGVPTYNFGVVVDDIDMNITHVIRGDDHVNNTPRQINIYEALGVKLPQFAHVPMILGDDGERLSKRHGAVSVMQYSVDGFLPEAVLNYLARLGWSHGDSELFTVSEFVEWFDLAHVSHSPAQFNPEKLRWINQQYLKNADDEQLATSIRLRIEVAGGNLNDGPPLREVVAILKSRSETLAVLAEEAMMFYRDDEPAPDLLAIHVPPTIRPVLQELAAQLIALPHLNQAGINEAVRGMLKKHGLKMPNLALPMRVCIFGRTQTPDFATVLTLAGKARIADRIQRFAS